MYPLPLSSRNPALPPPSALCYHLSVLYQPPSSKPSPGVRVALIGAIVIVCYQLYSLAFQIYRDSQIDIQYQNLLVENKQLEEERNALTQLVAYLQTPGYREKEQKKISNLVRPGERTLILERPAGGETDAVGSADADIAVDSIPHRWWNFLFGEDNLLSRDVAPVAPLPPVE